jgi:hypothetical protein
MNEESYAVLFFFMTPGRLNIFPIAMSESALWLLPTTDGCEEVAVV